MKAQCITGSLHNVLFPLKATTRQFLIITLSRLCLSTKVQQRVTGLGGGLLSWLRAARPNTSFLTWSKWRESKQNNRAEKQHSKSAKNSKLDPVLPALSSQLVLGNRQSESEHVAKTLPGWCVCWVQLKLQTKFICRYKTTTGARYWILHWPELHFKAWWWQLAGNDFY